MIIKSKNRDGIFIIFGERENEYFVYDSSMHFPRWQIKEDFHEIKELPEYLSYDENNIEERFIEIYKRKYDLDFYCGKIHSNESLTPQYFEYKRLKLALNTLSLNPNAGIFDFDNPSLFLMLVGKFESINEVIDSRLQERESHSRFEWYFVKNGKKHYQTNIRTSKPIQNFEEKLIELCKLVSNTIEESQYSKFIFFDLYASWKTFLLGNNLELLEVVNIDYGKAESNDFSWSMIGEEGWFYFKYQYFDWG